MEFYMIRRMCSVLSFFGVFSMLVTGVWAGGHQDCFAKSMLSQVNKLVEDCNSGKITFDKAQKKCCGMLEMVKLAGKVVHFGAVDAMTPVPGALVSISEFPATKYLNVVSDDAGCWSMPIVKIKKVPLKVSFLFEKEWFQTAKSNIFTIKSQNIEDIVMQFPDLQFFGGAKGMLEYQMTQLIGKPYPMQNILVTTVGKSWASMFLDQFPHGDPGAVVRVYPEIEYPALGPVYFNENVLPDLTTPYISVDGGVLFANLANGYYKFSASKSPYKYTTVEFEIESDIQLYIASPPHGLQSNNDSAPGEW